MSVLACKTCSISGCPRDKAYAVIKNNKIYRITFSKSLAEHIVSKFNDSYEVKRVAFRLGERLEAGQISKTGLYAIVSEKNNWTLRITLFQQIADTFRDASRYVAECFIEEEI